MAKRRTARSRHLDRIRRQMRRMESRGYSFSDEFKASLSTRSTQSLAHLKTPGLYKRATAQIVNTETGEIQTLSGTAARKFERKQAARKAAETRRERKAQVRDYQDKGDYDIPDISAEIIDHLDALLFRMGQPVSETGFTKNGKEFTKPDNIKSFSQGIKNTLQKRLDAVVKRDGEAVVAERLYRNSEMVDMTVSTVEYSGYKGTIANAAQSLLNIIEGRSADDRSGIEPSLADTFEAEYEGWEEV